MRSFLTLLLIPAILSASEVELRLLDGSVIRGEVSDALVVELEYGNLTIPISHIRKIDFGVHYNTNEERELAEAIKELASLSHPIRDKRTKELASKSWRFLPLIDLLTNSEDMEVRKRAEIITKAIRSNSPAEKRQPVIGDYVVTVKFPVKGNVQAKTIKIQSKILGTIEVGIHHIACLQSQTANSRTFELDPIHALQNDKWFNTDMDVESFLAVEASGNIDLWPQTPGSYQSGPEGYVGNAGVDGTFKAGQLVAKIGYDGRPFAVGKEFNGTCASGRLWLRIWPSVWPQAPIGAYAVKVRVVR